jgi:hypothetical protein
LHQRHNNTGKKQHQIINRPNAQSAPGKELLEGNTIETALLGKKQVGNKKATKRKEDVDTDPTPGADGIKSRQGWSNGRTKSSAFYIGNPPQVMQKNQKEGKGAQTI